MHVLVPGMVPVRTLRTLAGALAGLAGLAVLWSLRLTGGGGADRADRGLAAQLVCAAHGWQPFVPAAGQRRPRQVYDLCLVSDELDWLEIRLNTTYDEVDYFVVVEAPYTVTGQPKPLAVRDHWDRFAPYHTKMLYRALAYPPHFDPPRPRDRGDLQRNALLLQVLVDGEAAGEEAADGSPPRALAPAAVPEHGDVLVVADVDEIPRPAALRALRLCRFPRRLTLASRFYRYGFQFRRRGADWPHPQATVFAGDRTILPVHLRNGDGGRGLRPRGGAAGALVDAVVRAWDTAALPDAAWHCSSCFATMAALLRTLESVPHAWRNHGVSRDPDRAADRVRHGLDVGDRPAEVYDRVPNNVDVPGLLRAEPDRFRYLLDRDGPSAGFRDYPGEEAGSNYPGEEAG